MFISPPLPLRPRVLLALTSLALALALPAARAQQFTWEGNGNAFKWSDPNNWSPAAVPGTGSNVFVPTHPGPYVDLDVTIGSLTLQNRTSVNIIGDGMPHNLTVTGTTTITHPATPPSSQGGELTVDDGSTWSLGTLANFSNGQLTGGYNIYDSDFLATRTPTVLQFRGANVIDNRANVDFLGDDAYMRDQDSGLDAFRNLAVNNGSIFREDSPPQSTVGNLTNNGSLYVYDYVAGARSSYTVNGSLTNNADGYVEAYGNSEIIVKGNLVNHGTGNDGALYVFNESRAAAGEALVRVEQDLINDGTIVVSGESGRPARLEVLGATTNTGDITLNGVGAVNVDGVLTMAGGRITMTGNTGVETFIMTAKRIDHAAGTEWGARGTVFADLVGRGVLAPGASPGTLTLHGNMMLESTAELKIELGGTAPGTQYDQIVQHSTGTGGVTLGGKLNIAFVSGFESTVTNSDTFTILASDLALSGAFSNVASGGTLKASNGSGAFTVTYNGNSVVLSSYAATPLTLSSAFSRKAHGTQVFDLPLSLVSPSTTESRRGPVATDHQLWFTFSNAIVSGNATVTGGTATIAGTPYISGNSMAVDLTGASDAQKITITLSNVTDTLGQVLPSTAVSVRILVGDSNGDGTVNSGDALQTRSRSGQDASATNFRSDVNSDGTINGGDALVVRSRSGNAVAP